MNRLLWKSGGDAILHTPPSGYLGYRYTHMFTLAQLCSPVDCLRARHQITDPLFSVFTEGLTRGSGPLISRRALSKTAPPQSSIFEVECTQWLTTVWLNQRINSAGSGISGDGRSEGASRSPHFTRPNRGRPYHAQPVRCSRRARLPPGDHFTLLHDEASPFRIFLQVP
jgi:hypothetical protein